jgi:hypothetical protein
VCIHTSKGFCAESLLKTNNRTEHDINYVFLEKRGGEAMPAGCVRQGAKRAGRSILEDAKFVSSSILDAIRKSLESQGIPTKRSYWKERVLDAVFVTAMAFLTIYACYNVLLTSFDPSFWDYVRYGYVPKGATIVPYSNPQHYDYSDEPYLVIPEPMSVWDWAGLFSPIIVPLLAFGIEYIRYRRWKESTA